MVTVAPRVPYPISWFFQFRLVMPQKIFFCGLLLQGRRGTYSFVKKKKKKMLRTRMTWIKKALPATPMKRLGSSFSAFMIKMREHPTLAACGRDLQQRGQLLAKMYRRLSPEQIQELREEANCLLVKSHNLAKNGRAYIHFVQRYTAAHRAELQNISQAERNNKYKLAWEQYKASRPKPVPTP